MFWGHREAILGHLGAILGPSRAVLGPSWGHLGPSWGHLGAILGPVGAILRPSWAVLGRLGAILGHLRPKHPPEPKKYEKRVPKPAVFGLRNGPKIRQKRNQFWGPFWDPSQDHFGRVLGPLWVSIFAQDGPKRSLEAPERALWRSKKPKRSILKKCHFPIGKLYFLVSVIPKVP